MAPAAVAPTANSPTQYARPWSAGTTTEKTAAAAYSSTAIARVTETSALLFLASGHLPVIKYASNAKHSDRLDNDPATSPGPRSYELSQGGQDRNG